MGEVKTDLFIAQPELSQVYESYNVKKEARRNERRRQHSTDLTQSNTWRVLAKMCDQGQVGDERVWRQLVEKANAKGDVLKMAAVVHFFGKLPLTPAGSRRLLRLLKYAHNAPWVWKSDEIPDTYVTHYPVLYETCEALAKHPSPKMWEVLLDTYFAQGYYRETVKEWVLYQTECLSGLDEPFDNHRYVWPAEERIWFKALVEAETCDS